MNYNGNTILQYTNLYSSDPDEAMHYQYQYQFKLKMSFPLSSLCTKYTYINKGNPLQSVILVNVT